MRNEQLAMRNEEKSSMYLRLRQDAEDMQEISRRDAETQRSQRKRRGLLSDFFSFAQEIFVSIQKLIINNSPRPPCLCSYNCRASGLARALLCCMLAVFCLISCETPPENISSDIVVNISAIEGLTLPQIGGTPAKTITDTVQYTGTVTWSPERSSFAFSTAYTAIITLTAREGYTFDGVPGDFFNVEGADIVTNAENSGIVIAVFPVTGAPDSILFVTDYQIPGVRKPVYGEPPMLSIKTEQLTGTIVWSPDHNVFAANTEYVAIITLEANDGFIFEDIFTNVFTVTGANETTNAANSNIVTALFPRTGNVHLETISIAVILGVTPPAVGEIPAVNIIETEEYTGSVSWNPDHSVFEADTIYEAVITITSKDGYTLFFVPENFFIVSRAIASNAEHSGIINAEFPKTLSNPSLTISINNVGVTAPMFGLPPVSVITLSNQFTGTVTWSPNHSTFERGEVYTATINLTAAQGFTLQGIGENFFEINGATAINAANSGLITAVFPAVPSVSVSILAIPGITPPAVGGVPVRSITTAEYTGTVLWQPEVIDTFYFDTEYTAVITLTTEKGFTLQGIPSNRFTVQGANATNAAGQNIVYAVFPRTALMPVTTVSITDIEGITPPVAGESPVTVIIATDEYTGTVEWTPNHGTFQRGYVYTATINLTAVYGYTFHGVEQDLFKVAGAAASNNENSGTITAVFPEVPSVAVSIRVIPGLTPPEEGDTPVRSIATAQYTGAVTWQPDDAVFAFGTQYTAYINLTTETGFNLQEIQSDFFTVEGALSVTYSNSVVTVIFPNTGVIINVSIADIELPAPVTGEIPVREISCEQYTGAVTWSPAAPDFFQFNTDYTATISLTLVAGFTLDGVPAGFFNVDGASSVSNAANSGEITAVFPRTATPITVNFYDGSTLLGELTRRFAVETEIDLPDYTKTGFTLTGWQINGTGRTYNGSYTATGNVNFYARWNEGEDWNRISTADELNAVRTNVTTLGAKYFLVNDISLSGYSNWNSIGNSVTPFTGIFDGNSYKITDLSGSNGLFAYIRNASIINLGVEISAAGINGYMDVGAITGFADNSTISNCYSSGNITIEYFNAGGITGRAINNSIIINCYSTGNISSAGYQTDHGAGGIVGSLQGGSVRNSFSTGNISDTSNINSSTGSNAGGITGVIFSVAANITNCYSTGDITSRGNAGGIVGRTSVGSMSNCYSTGNIIGSTGSVGGIAGSHNADGDSVTGCAAINTLITASANNSAGRITGHNFSSLTETGNFALNSMDSATGGFSALRPGQNGTSKTISELRTRATYESVSPAGLGWSFGNNDDNPWVMPLPDGSGYPKLYWENN